MCLEATGGILDLFDDFLYLYDFILFSESSTVHPTSPITFCICTTSYNRPCSSTSSCNKPCGFSNPCNMSCGRCEFCSGPVIALTLAVTFAVALAPLMSSAAAPALATDPVIALAPAVGRSNSFLTDPAGTLSILMDPFYRCHEPHNQSCSNSTPGDKAHSSITESISVSISCLYKQDERSVYESQKVYLRKVRRRRWRWNRAFTKAGGRGRDRNYSNPDVQCAVIFVKRLWLLVRWVHSHRWVHSCSIAGMVGSGICT